VWAQADAVTVATAVTANARLPRTNPHTAKGSWRRGAGLNPWVSWMNEAPKTVKCVFIEISLSLACHHPPIQAKQKCERSQVEIAIGETQWYRMLVTYL
jgi:hypothetical protein